MARNIDEYAKENAQVSETPAEEAPAEETPAEWSIVTFISDL